MEKIKPFSVPEPGKIKGMDGTYPVYCTRRLWLTALVFLIVADCYFHVYVYYNVLQIPKRYKKFTENANRLWNYNKIENQTSYYKYPLVNGSEASMDYESAYNSSYFWFISMQNLFKDLGYTEPLYQIVFQIRSAIAIKTCRGANATPKDSGNMLMCKSNTSSVPSIFVSNSEPDLKWIEEQNSDVAVGGYYAPVDCKPVNRVAIIVPYRNRRVNLAIFLRYIHPFLKKQSLEYRIFVIEQHGTEKFNKGTLNNIAFLESQRFGSWHCLIYHDVDLVPEDERIPYSCPDRPTHLSVAVKSFGYVLPYRKIFGGVTAITPKDYSTVNGYSNFYWNWGAEDDDFYARLVARNMSVARYNESIARYATLPHNYTDKGSERFLLLMLSKIRCRKEGLATTKYKLLKVTEEKLYTHILADVNPTKLKLDMKNIMQRVLQVHGENIVYGRREFLLANPGN